MDSNFLDKIALTTQARVDNATVSISDLKQAVKKSRIPHSFIDLFQQQDCTVIPPIIAEIKFASPSLGPIAAGDPVTIAKQYLSQGASAISILTEPDYFLGSLDYLKQVRDALPEARLLMKDFILDEYQLLQARIYGADAILLIVAFLTPQKLQSLYTAAQELGLTPLVEVHSLDELKAAESISASLIGINNRNLKTLVVDLSTSSQLIKQAQTNAAFIAESGLKTGTDLSSLQKVGFKGFLIGSQFMRHEKPGDALQTLIREAQDAR